VLIVIVKKNQDSFLLKHVASVELFTVTSIGRLQIIVAILVFIKIKVKSLKKLVQSFDLVIYSYIK